MKVFCEVGRWYITAWSELFVLVRLFSFRKVSRGGDVSENMCYRGGICRGL
jgi:hypothetical protein